MRVFFFLALLATTPAVAQDCSRFSDPMAYNACLASGGPAARKVRLGAAPAHAGSARTRRPAGRAVSGRGRSRMVFSVGK